MIKLRKRNEETHQVRFYLLQRASSASPDYVGLQIIYGIRNGRSLTRFFWFKSKLLPNGKTLSATEQLQRKVSSLVLRRLRSGYVLTRKSDNWCKAPIAKSIARSQRPKRPKPSVVIRSKIKPWERQQLSFDFS